MRIVAGSRGGRKLHTGRTPGFRPTSDKVRGAIFSILDDRVRGAVVLDLYAGSGALGFEALSRGASRALFVERNGRAASWIERNGKSLRLDGAFAVETIDVLRFLRVPGGAASCDLVFADPPYDRGLVDPTLDLLDRFSGRRLVVLERHRREEPSAERPAWRGAKRYGDTVVEFLCVGEENPEEGGA